MYLAYLDDEKLRLEFAMHEARTPDEIEKLADEIARMWVALGCPANM